MHTQYASLSTVKHQVSVGSGLPFNVFREDLSLLLARGQVVASHTEMASLLERGALVDMTELLSPCDLIRHASPAQLPALWLQCSQQLSDALCAPSQAGFINALDAALPAVLTLIERDKDLAIFQVIKRGNPAQTQYGVRHSLHSAITSFLVAKRLGWSDGETHKVFKVALTMNISILELQGQMAEQDYPSTGTQREAIYAHPDCSCRMLELAGISDQDWLQAVARHHETTDGQGYPSGRRDPGDLASLVQRADAYTAMLSPRCGRDAMSADRAARMMFMQNGSHPMTAALVKEFGIYPPGCFVRLASGETGVVVKRGASVMTPVVAVLTTPFGATLTRPIRRDTSERGYCIHTVLGDRGQLERMPAEALTSMA